MPGPAVPPTVKIPVAPTGLVANQVGERVLLRWTVERQHTDGTRMEHWPRLEVYRAFLADATKLQETFVAEARVAYVLPEPLVESFLRNGIVVFPDALGAGRLKEQAGRTAVYGVKAVNDRGQDVGFAGLATVRVYPVATPIDRVETRVTEKAIELRWGPPLATTSGTPLEAIAGYQVYRSETGEEGSYALRGAAPAALYEDSDFRFGVRYFYRIRTLAQFGVDTVESESSVTAEVEARDLFPPPVPQNLIVIAGPERVDLTWDASDAPDLAGYFVYRSEQPAGSDTRLNVVHQRLNAQPLRVQSYADTTARAGVRYYYAVTAVDADGNESPFSQEAAVTVLGPE